MSADILAFPAHASASDLAKALGSHVAEVDSLVVELGTQGEWVASAINHLKLQSSGRTDGSADVSIAALHLILGYVEDLEQRLGLHGLGGAA